MIQPGQLATSIFQPPVNFEETALQIFQFQYRHNIVYKKYVQLLGVQPHEVNNIKQIPFLPISFFKTHTIKTTTFNAAAIFESSGTTATINSKHHIKNLELYEQSFMAGFQKFYGNVKDYCVIGLLPSYLERGNSSLVYMVNHLIKQSGHAQSGFYLHEYDKLAAVLKTLEAAGQKTILIGVTFALLDFAAACPMPLRYTTIVETGGMKGRREELLREEVHAILKNAFGVNNIHSEYGMTELLSQAWSKGNGIFYPASTLQILLRDEEDPLTIKNIQRGQKARGVINMIDLANIYSCSFIATDDLGEIYADGSFSVIGRMDSADLRGCSLLTI